MNFINYFEDKVFKTIKRYNLLTKNDKVIVACSGGKDSTTVLYLLNKFNYDAEALIIDLLIGTWSKKNLENIKNFCKRYDIKLHIVDMREEFGSSICYIRSHIQSKTKLKNCYICGVIKRYLLNKKARELGATKLATGHNLDDEAETILMNTFKANPRLNITLGPITGVIKDKKFVQRIKPLYFCTNEEVKKYSKMMNFMVLYEPCPCSLSSFRKDVRNIFLREDPRVKESIVSNFLKILPKLREHYYMGEELNYCKLCKEPTRREICKTCQLMKRL